MQNIFKILSYTKTFWKWYLFMGIFVVLSSLLSLVTPILLKYIVDAIVTQVTKGGVDISTVVTFLVFIVITDVSISAFSAFGMWIGDILAVRLNTYLTHKFYEHLLSLHIGYYDNEITGKIVNKMYRGIESITMFINNMTNNFLPFFLTAAVTIVLLSRYSLFIALLLAILFPLYIFISHNSTVAWGSFEEKKNKIADISQGRVFESINGIRVVKSFAAELVELATYLTSRKHIEGFTVLQTKRWHWYDFLRRFALNIILFAIFSYIVYTTFHGKYTIGEMTLLFQLVQQARFPLFAMSFILGQIQQADAGSKDFFEILETRVAVSDQPHASALRLTRAKDTQQRVPHIWFKHVTFTYDKGKPILNDVSFTVKEGEKLALVGESGQGKSTIVNLLLRFYEPDSGLISVGGRDISRVSLSSLRSHIAVVFQDSLLFSGTVFENIAYGKENATKEEVEKAAKAANAHEFIRELPEQYNALIGERGVKLSGGQKQRIAISRAILKDAPIIILDEATSSLDSKSEILVQQGLSHLFKKRTAIVIAHRLSTIADADHIVVVSRGRIMQYGTPKELLEDKTGFYAKMVSLQKQLMTGSSEDRDAMLKEFDLVS